MATQIAEFVGALRQQLQLQKQELMISMGAGKCEDHEHYKKMVGEIRGLDIAAEVAVALWKRSDVDELDEQLSGMPDEPENPPPPSRRRGGGK